MNTKFMQFLWLSLFFALALSACGAAKPVLSPEVITSLNTYADQYDVQYPDSSDINVARVCVQEPIALYWQEETKIWAVACLMDFPGTMNTYGVVLIDSATNVVVFTDYINAVSVEALEEIIAPGGWVRK